MERLGFPLIGLEDILQLVEPQHLLYRNRQRWLRVDIRCSDRQLRP
jgi:hypothetical protein